jgi:hypothetical protein
MEQTTKSDTANPTAESAQPPRLTIRHPVVHVMEKSPSRRRRRTSSRGARRLTEIDRRVSKTARRVTRALDHGVDTYVEHRDDSKEKRRDGAVVDFVENVSYGVSKTISEASPVLHDVAEAFNTQNARKQIRKITRGFANLPLIG